MCAIAGIVNLRYDEAIIQSMLGTMEKRGPDGNGVAMTQKCCLLHTRLAIIDPEGGKQPMKLLWNGLDYTIVYNGELYNTDQLRLELQKLGHTFEGHSDTEVLLHAFAQWKQQCLEKLNGIFAFAVMCRQTGEIFLARDRMGVKPLFYKEHKGGLLFSSEIKTILQYPDVERQLDAEGMAQVLLLGPGRIPGSGVFKNIKELEPGCCAYFCTDSVRVVRYWGLKDREHNESFEQTCEHVRYLVLDAIEKQMISDVPIGTFLSGGLDSSLITSVCTMVQKERGELLPTFSLDFLDNDKYFVPGQFQQESDNAYIEKMQMLTQTKHSWCILTPDALVESLTDATKARDLPGMADVDSSLLLLCDHISQHVKVALSGECADEIFGGYPWYRDSRIQSQVGFPWAQNTSYRAGFLLKDQNIKPQEFVMDHYNNTINQCDILPQTSPKERRMKEMVNLNYRWFMQTLLDRKDRMSMHNGLEVRVPFCDHRIAEYMYGVPWHFMEYHNVEKGLLRRAMEGYLPKEILWRKKTPYPKTYSPRYLALVEAEIKYLLERKDAPIFAFVRKQKLADLLDVSDGWPWYGQLMQRPQIMAYMLQINLWLEQYKISIL